MGVPQASWAEVLSGLINDSHLVTGDQLSATAHQAVQPLGLTAEVLIVDIAQRQLIPIRPRTSARINVEGTVAGRTYQLGEIQRGTDAQGRQHLWVPMLDGTDRVGVVRIGLMPHVADSRELRQRCWALSGLLGHITVSKMPYSERLRWLRGNGPLTPAAEMLWQLLPPRTFATPQLVVTALVEPHDRVAGDAYDYSVNADDAFLAVYDGVGHDLQAGQTTALAITAVRHGRREGRTDLVELAARADELLMAQPGPTNFVTAVLATLDTRSGILRYLLAGHPPPLLLRARRTVKELDAAPRPPLGIPPVPAHPPMIGTEKLEPGDRLLLYSDGITEARNNDGQFFGEERLIDFTERAELDRLPAPETLRRLTASILAHQHGLLQDDATLLMADWSSDAHERMFPVLDP
ncbi:PP2C family protein-serine/threonine phosphatase [Pseudonocardia sp. TRM90224]|uniref:PP2C family protein-serine/threonine phosphatase n=1 Tax=Pseudonocardia sp. TRM90224 TaxID=2812678 RepID=UPI001E4EBE91|nr:PP2C family protein-serine/threonine phosphatase [Pseudonocardia sp. TRM90224]